MPKPTPTFGVMGVDWEQRVGLDRLRTERLDRIKGILAEADAYWGMLLWLRAAIRQGILLCRLKSSCPHWECHKKPDA